MKLTTTRRMEGMEKFLIKSTNTNKTWNNRRTLEICVGVGKRLSRLFFTIRPPSFRQIMRCQKLNQQLFKVSHLRKEGWRLRKDNCLCNSNQLRDKQRAKKESSRHNFKRVKNFVVSNDFDYNHNITLTVKKIYSFLWDVHFQGAIARSFYSKETGLI